MGLPAIGDLLLVTFRGTIFNQRVMNTFWYSIRTLNVTNTPTIETVATQINAQIGLTTAWLTAYKAVLPEFYSIDELWVQRVFPQRIMKEVFVIAENGSHAAEGICCNLQASIMRRTEVAEPGNVGGVRICMPDISTAGDQGGLTVLYKGLLTAFAAKMDDVLTLAVGTTVEPVLPTRLPPVPPAKQGVIDGSRDIDRITVMDTVRTLSRRTVGRGE